MVILGTSNLNKLKEYNIIAPYFDFKLSENIDVEENGSSFLENAIIKSKATYEKYKCAVLTDDSGLEIFSLKGFPGIFSRRFENNRGYEVACNDLIERLRPFDNKKARYVCAVCFIDEKGNIYTNVGYMNGKINDIYEGSNGFGYDPIFIPDGYDKTFGQLDYEIKNSISHRKKAIDGLIKKLPPRILKRYYHD